MQLFHRHIGQGQAFVILHGLYGSSDNWLGLARGMQNCFEFFIPDMRNHGQSGHSANFSYMLMSDDIYKWIKKLEIQKPVIMGHSIGGKIAMELVKNYPDTFSALIALDVSPLSYAQHPREGLLNHKNIIQSMLSIDLKLFNKRDDVEKELSKLVNNFNLSKLLMKNLSRDQGGSFRWRLNLESLMNNYNTISEGITDNNYRCPLPALFIKAQNSDYVNEQDKKAISVLYPRSQFVEIPNAQHWLHISQPSLLKTEIYAFLTNIVN